MTVQNLKDQLRDAVINSYQWLPTYEMWAYVFTKEMKMQSGLQSLLLDNNLYLPDEMINLVWSVGLRITDEKYKKLEGVIYCRKLKIGSRYFEPNLNSSLVQLFRQTKFVLLIFVLVSQMSLRKNQT